jgi:ABC-2 type transport system permease protein
MVAVVGMLIRMHLKTQVEYRGAFLLDRVAQILSYGAAYAAIWVLLNRFGSLGGWGWPDLALLLSFQLLAYSLGASLSFVQFRDLEEQVRLGKFDTLMVKPISPWAYLTFGGFNIIGYAGHIVLALGLMVWSLLQANVDWSIWSALYFVLVLISAAMVVAALMTMIGVAALVLVQSSYLYSIFFGFWELTRYPINIFPPALQWMLVTIVPLGFMNYVPVAVFLGKDVAILGGWAMPLSLLAGPVTVAFAMWHWRWSIRHYQGEGG